LANQIKTFSINIFEVMEQILLIVEDGGVVGIENQV